MQKVFLTFLYFIGNFSMKCHFTKKEKSERQNDILGKAKRANLKSLLSHGAL